MISRVSFGSNLGVQWSCVCGYRSESLAWGGVGKGSSWPGTCLKHTSRVCCVRLRASDTPGSSSLEAFGGKLPSRGSLDSSGLL